MTDQQRVDTIAALGNPLIKTPALDLLVREGTTFTRCYTPSPICVSARCCLATGQPAHVTGCTDNMPMPERTSMMEELRDAGYQTHGVGKMHFTPDLLVNWGFEQRDIMEEGLWEGDEYTAYLRKQGYSHLLENGGMRSEYYYLPQPSQVPSHHHQSTWVADRSIEFLQRRDTERPFFLWASWIKPHPPFESPVPWSKLYRPEESGYPFLPEDGEDVLTVWNRIQNRYKWRDNGQDGQLIRTIRAAYFACISFIDYNIGRLLTSLGDEIENTVVLFVSDHGELLGDYGCFGKRSMLDPSVRVPLLVRYPETFPASIRCDTPVSLLDIWPTLLNVAGVTDAASKGAGSDLVGIASGGEPERAVISQFQQNHLGLYMLATRRRKYVYSAYDRKEWLFDISGPAMSMAEKNVTGDARHADELASMRNQLLETLGENHAVDGRNWREFPRPELGLDDPDFGLLYQDDPMNGAGLQACINQLPEGYRRKVYKTGRESVELLERALEISQ